MPNRTTTPRLADRLAPLIGVLLALVLLGSALRLGNALQDWGNLRQAEALHPRVNALLNAGNLLLRYRRLQSEAEAAGNALALRDEIDRLLQEGIPFLIDQDATWRDNVEAASQARQEWFALTTAKPGTPEARQAAQDLLAHLDALLRELLSDRVRHNPAMAGHAQLRLAAWELRLAMSEESLLRARDASAEEKARARLATETTASHLMNAARLMGEDAIIAEARTAQANFSALMKAQDAADPERRRQALTDYLTRSSPVVTSMQRLHQATHEAGSRRLAAIGAAQRDLVYRSLGEILMVLLLGGGILVFRRRVRQPLERLQMALSGADAYYVDWHVPSRVVEYHEGFDVMLGFQPGEIPRTVDGLRWLYHPEDAVQLNAAHRAAYRGETDKVDAELRIRRKGGGWHWIHIRVRVVDRDQDGRAIRLIGIVYDANARHQAEDELRRLRQEEEAIFSASPVAMMIVHDRIIRRCNHAAERLFGREPGGLDGHPTRVLFDTEAEYEAIGDEVYNALRQKPDHTYEAEYLRHRHGRFWARVECSLLDPTDPGLGYVFVFQDITAARKAKLDLDNVLQRQRALFAAIPDGVVILRDRAVVDCNPRFAEIYGYTPAELIGQSTRIFYTGDQDWEAHGRTVYRAIADGGVYRDRERVRRRDGSIIEVLVQGGWIDPDDPERGAVFAHTPLQVNIPYP